MSKVPDFTDDVLDTRDIIEHVKNLKFEVREVAQGSIWFK